MSLCVTDVVLYYYVMLYFCVTLLLCYIILFKEIALQVSEGNSSLNFPHAEWHLVIVASSKPPPGQIQSPR